MKARDAAPRPEQLAESERRLPGPAYYKVLKWIHQILQPSNYLEIGVHKGVSLHQANRDTPCIIGVDPSPNILPQIQRQLPVSAATIYELTSDEFFARR